MNDLDKLLDLVDLWDETPLDSRGEPAAFCSNFPELQQKFLDFLAQRFEVGKLLQGSAEPTLPDSLLNKLRSDRFALLRFHDSGGLGWVYVGQDLEFGRTVAIKVLQPSHATDPSERRRFLREAELTSILEHPGIVPIYGLERGDESGQPYYAMRFIEGETLRSAILRLHQQETQIDWRGLEGVRLLRAFIQVCDTVAYAHSRGVIHRDLKSLNVMLGPFGETLVLDWGLAKVARENSNSDRSNRNGSHDSGEGTRTDSLKVRGASSPTSTFTNRDESSNSQRGTWANVLSTIEGETRQGNVAGTIGFMSPEQAKGEWDQVDSRSDIFSLGAILYQMLTGVTPYRGEKGIEAAIQCKFPRPRTQKRATPKALEAICLKSMSSQAIERYQTAFDLKRDIELFLADLPVSAHSESIAERGSRFLRRNRTSVFVASCLMLVIVGLLAFFLQKSTQQNSLLTKANDKWRAAAKEAAQSAWNESVRAEEAIEERKRANREATEANALADTMISMFADSTPWTQNRPLSLSEWILAKLDKPSFWKELSPTRAGPLRYYLALTLIQNNRQQEAVPVLRDAILSLERTKNESLLRDANLELGLLLVSRTANWEPDEKRTREGIARIEDILKDKELADAEKMRAKLILAQSYFINENRSKATEIVDPLLVEMERSPEVDPRMRANAFAFSARLKTLDGDADAAVAMLRRLLEEKNEEIDLVTLDEVKFQLAYALGWQGVQQLTESYRILEEIYPRLRERFEGPLHPSVLRVGDLFATTLVKANADPVLTLKYFERDFGQRPLSEASSQSEAIIIATVALARCQVGEAVKHWKRADVAIEYALRVNPPAPHLFYLRILVAKEMALQGLGEEAIPLAQSTYERITVGDLKDRKDAAYLLVPTLRVLYGVQLLSGREDEAEKTKTLFPPGVAVPMIPPDKLPKK